MNHAGVSPPSVFGFQISQRFRVDGDNSENASRVDADILHRDKKMHFQTYPDTCGQGLKN